MIKQILTIMVFTFSFAQVIGQTDNPNYDVELAKELGGDDYGMKSFVLVILKSGSNKEASQALKDSCFRGHMYNINRLVDENKLIVAGPIGKNDRDYRGIFILNVTTLEEAKALLDTDPSIASKILDVELYKWYGSAALSTYLEASDKIWKIQH